MKTSIKQRIKDSLKIINRVEKEKKLVKREIIRIEITLPWIAVESYYNNKKSGGYTGD